MAKRIRTDRAHLEMGKFKSNYPGVDDIAELEVTIRDDRAKVGFHMYRGADETERAVFAKLFATRKWIEMDEIDGPEEELKDAPSSEEARDDADPVLGTIEQTLEEGAAEPVEDTEEVGKGVEESPAESTDAAPDEDDEGEPPAATPKKGNGRRRSSVAARVAKAAKAVKEPKAPKVRKEHVAKTNFANWRDYYANSGTAKRAAAAEGKPLFRPGSKREQAYHLLLKGTTMEDVAEAFGWKKSAVGSCFMQLEAVLGITYAKTKEAGKPMVYRIPGPADEERVAAE